MTLTGKCKDEFYKWARSNDRISRFEYSILDKLSEFILQPLYIEFFNSVNITIDVRPFIKYDENKYIRFSHFFGNIFLLGTKSAYSIISEDESSKDMYSTLIKKSNNIYNNLNYDTKETKSYLR